MIMIPEFSRRESGDFEHKTNVTRRPLETRNLVVVPDYYTPQSQSFSSELAADLRNHEPDKIIRLMNQKISGFGAAALAGFPDSLQSSIDLEASDRVYNPLSFAHSCVRLCNMLGAFRRKYYPDKENLLADGYNEAAAYFSGAGKEIPDDPLIAIQKFLMSEVKVTASRVPSLDTGKLLQGIDSILSHQPGRIPPELGAVLIETLGFVQDKHLEDLKSSHRRAAAFLGQNYVGIRPPEISLICQNIARSFLPQALIRLSASVASVSFAREMDLAFKIVKEPFEHGVLHCDYKQATSESFQQLLLSSGIRPSVRAASR